MKVPTYLYKLAYDFTAQRRRSTLAGASRPISFQELVNRGCI